MADIDMLSVDWKE